MIRSIIFVIVFFILLFILDVICTHIIPQNTTTKNYWLLNTKNEKFDYAFIGPSRVLHSIDGEIFEKKNGAKVINLGLSGVAYAEQFLVLNSFITDNGNKIKELFIEVSYYNFIDPDSAFSYPFHEYFYFPIIKRQYVFNTILENSKNKLKTYFWRYIPFVRYAEFNTEFLPLVFSKYYYFKNQELATFDTYGTEFLQSNADTLKLRSQFYKNTQIDTRTIGYLEKMIELARKNNIKVSFITTPVYGKRVEYTQAALMNYKMKVKELVEKHKVDYFDYEHHQICSNIANFHDYTHLNRAGGMNFSSELSDTLLKRGK